MYIYFLILVIVFYAVLPLVGVVQTARRGRKPLDSILTEKDRVNFYIKIIANNLGQALVILIFCLLAAISLYDIGLRGISLSQNIWFTVITLIVSGGYLIARIGGMIALLVSPKYREEQKEELAKKNPNGAVNNMLPRSKKERWYWLGVSLTAGIGEEIIFHGFLFFILQAVFPNMPILLALAIASAIFGIGHAYQGIRGVAITAGIGALLGSLFLVTGSLIPSMFLHFILDISSVFSLFENAEQPQCE